MLVELDLLRCHGLRLHDELRLPRATDRRHDATSLLGVLRPIDLRSDGLGLAREAFDERREVVDRALLARGKVIAQRRPVDLGHTCVAALAERGHRALERDAQSLRRQRAIQLSLELDLRGSHLFFSRSARPAARPSPRRLDTARRARSSRVNRSSLALMRSRRPCRARP